MTGGDQILLKRSILTITNSNYIGIMPSNDMKLVGEISHVTDTD